MRKPPITHNYVRASGTCPACGEAVAGLDFMLGHSEVIVLHDADSANDFAGFTIEQLLGISLCKIDRCTGEASRRNYPLRALAAL
jgi:hypothetical protein